MRDRTDAYVVAFGRCDQALMISADQALRVSIIEQHQSRSSIN